MYTVYTGERVRLRPWKDADELFEYSKQAHLAPIPILGAHWYSRGHEEQAMRDDGFFNPQRLCAFAIEDLASGKAVGLEVCIFMPEAPLAAELGTTVVEAYRGQGRGVEAKQLALCFLFENFPFERVGAYTMHTHTRSKRGIELLGMHFEGTIRCPYFSEGSLVDFVYYVLFREQWEQLDYRHSVKRGAR